MRKNRKKNARKKLPVFLGILIIFGLWLAVPVFFNEAVPNPTTTWSQVANAQDQGVVACGPGTDQRECDICGLYETGYNIIRLGFFLIEPIVVLMIIIGGILYITSAGYEERVGVAKKTLTGAIIGLVIIFIAYAAVKAITTAFGYSNNILDAVNCAEFEGTVVGGGTDVQQYVPSGSTARCDELGFHPDVCIWAENAYPPGAAGLIDPANLTPIQNIFMKPNPNVTTRYATSTVVSKLASLKTILDGKKYTLSTQKGEKTWRVNEAYPPTVKHNSPGHFNGTIIDIAVYPATPANYDILWQAIADAGFSSRYNESSFKTALMGETYQSSLANAHLHITD